MAGDAGDSPVSFPLGDSSSGPDWQGLLKWSLSHSDGTAPPRKLSEEDRKWFMEAMQAQTVDVIKRMKEITMVMSMPQEVLEAQGVSVEDLEDLLEELQSHVESVDMANDLNAIGGLTPLLDYLKNPNASIRARASEVIATMVQNNPKCQQLIMDSKGLEYLMSNFMSDSNITVRTKSLGALSCLIRNNKPGIAVFRLANGYTGLKDAITSENPRFQRKGLQVLQYLLHENPNDSSVALELGFVRLLISLVNNVDGDIRQAAMHSLVEIAQTGNMMLDRPGSESSGQLRQALESQIENLQLMKPEELATVKEERALLDSLWQACYNEPSSLRQNGLVALPGEDEPPPDVAGKIFDPPLRAWAAPRESKADESIEKPEASTEKPPLLLGGSPSG